MDAAHFDRLTRSLVTRFSRRSLLVGLTVLGLVQQDGAVTAIARQGHKHKPKIRRNAFGCVNVGDTCTRNAQCCSNRCQGNKGKKTCRAHDTGIVLGRGGGCRVADDSCGGHDTSCTTTAGEEGRCFVTTGNAGYCLFDGDCFPCTKDLDCVPFCGDGAACIVCDTSGTDCDTICNGPGNCTFPPQV